MYSLERLQLKELNIDWVINPEDQIMIEALLRTEKYQNRFDYRSKCRYCYELL